jgi:hypothetical protein
MEEATAAHRPLEMETASRRQIATTRARVWGSIGSAEIFAEGTAHTTTKRDVHHAGLARYRQGVVGGCWSLECMRASGARCRVAAPSPPPAERDYPRAKGNNNTHTHTHVAFFLLTAY